MSKDIYSVISKVIISEKATLLNEANNEVVFKVARDANKLEIKQAVEMLLGKKSESNYDKKKSKKASPVVLAVRTANYNGKLKRQRRSDAGRTAHWKKAIVRLAPGVELDLI